MIDFIAIRSNMFKTLNIHKSFNPETIFAGFEKRYQYLSKNEGLKSLLLKFSQKNLPINFTDIITEFNLAYEILKKEPQFKIEYEPSVQGNSKKPDFKIVGGNLLLYIQVKHMRKSKNFENQKKENPDSDLWYRVDDERQIRKALNTACEFRPPEEEALYLVAQEISFKANTRDVTHSQAVYGREQIDLNSGRCVGRDNSGFFYTQYGQRLWAYITLRRTNDLCVFDNYEKKLFINPHFYEQKEKLTALFDFCNVYDENCLPNN